MPRGDGATEPREGAGRRHGHHGGPHGDHHGGKYDWTGEDAERFLARARRGARRRYGPFARLVAESLPVAASRAPTLLDLGCGPGMLLVELRGLLAAATLVGVDPSKDMLDLARQVAGEGPAAPAFEVREGRAEAIPAEGGSVDLVACQNVLHEWDETARGFGEVARVLRPGGRLVILDFDGGYPRWKLGLIAGLARVLAGRDAAKSILRPFEDAFTEDQVHAFCQAAGMAVLSSRRRGRSLFVVAERPRKEL